MELQFEKYEATGNDFVMIDNRNSVFDEKDETKIKQICDRRFGIGADGLILIGEHENLDFEMKYFNSDGKEGTMCGNGGRCAAAFARKLKLSNSKHLFFKAIDGTHEAHITLNSIRLKMSDVSGADKIEKWCFLDTGSPHIVEFVNNLNEVNVKKKGREIRLHEKFRPAGVNVNFVEYKEKIVHIRTYERGVENETFSCGTGSVAAAISVYLNFDSHKTGKQKQEYEIQAPGGELKVSFETDEDSGYRNIWLEGPATHVFSGTI
ncbi:MAG: diaminopimelate epimerase [Bacteroidota bacterium]|nr:diaminopimelate epimerase [Bacteroidota bacterium]